MKFIELKKHLVSEKHFACYNLCGDDLFLINSSTSMFYNYIAHNNELSRMVLSTENLDSKSLLNALNSSSFFGGEKVVVIKDLEISKSKELLGTIKEYLKSPNELSILVVVSDQPIFDAKTNVKNFVLVDCNRLDLKMLNVWIASHLKEHNAKMEQGAIQKLIDYTNAYLAIISIELDKLISYAGEREITADDVESLVNKTLEYSIYELTENLGKGNTEKAFEIYDEMMNDKKVAPSVFGLIQNYFRRMFYSAVSQGTNAQICAELGVKEFAVKKAKESASYFSKATLKDIVELCADLDFKIKTSQIQYENAVNYLLMFILTKNKNAIN